MGIRYSKKDTLYLLYTMGKVGSSTAESMLEHSLHTHTLYGFPPCQPYHLYKFGRLRVLFRKLATYPIKRAWIRSHKEVRIITFYRDPLSRNPSMFFQDLPYWLVKYQTSTKVSTRSEDESFLTAAYERVMPHNYPEQWVRNELCRFTRIRYEDACLTKDSYKVIKKGNCTVFIGRSEAMDTCLEALVALGWIQSQAKDQDRNRATGKWYAQNYRDFIAALDPALDKAATKRFRHDNGYDS